MRKAKIAAIIFGGVSTCLCGGILGVYSTSSVVSSVAPNNDVQNIYNVESEKLANVAAVTSIRTTAITTTSTESTTTSVSSASIEEEKKDIKAVNLSFSPENCSPTITTTTIVAPTVETVETTETVVDVPTESDELFSGLVISGPFIADEEPDTYSEDDVITSDDESTEADGEDMTGSESSEDDFDFEPAIEYFPPAVEYVAPVPEDVEETTPVETTEVTTVEFTETTTSVSDAYVATETTQESTTETTVTTTAVESTEDVTATATTTTVAIESETTETSTTATAFVITVNYDITEDSTTTVGVEPESSLPLTDQEFVLLCNAVANEAGSDWISTINKGKVVEVIMNRVNSPLYPNSIFDVLAQPYQFEGSGNYVYLTTFSSYVTDDVKAAVELYFNEPESFTHNYFGFYGDGYQNYFY